MDSEDNYYYEYTPTVYEVLEYCVFPSINGILPTLKNLIIINFLFNVSIHSRFISETTYNGLSVLFGFLLLFFTLPELSIICIVVFTCLSYAFLLTICKIQKHRRLNLEYLTGFVCAITLVICEFGFNSDTWLQLRGFFMIACMKIISFTSDLQRGEENRSVIFFGYILCPANCLFGPWVPLNEYKALYKCPGKKNFNWATRIISSLLKAFFFLTLSNCWGTYFIPDGSFKWFEAYRQALSFRSSHYFISYLSETSMIIAGFNNKKNEQKKGQWSYEITHPLDIEIPSSLVSVVVSWNIPMHHFLKYYVYRTYLKYGRFRAIFITYFISSLLHGFNVEVAAVLLTIGIYSYVQLVVQDKLSSVFDSCLKVRPCKICKHKFTRKNIKVKLVHCLFSLLTIFHLIYLGVLMDAVGDPNRENFYEKWSNLYFLSHWVMLVTYFFGVI